jgi:hypothetical protein
VHVLRFVSAKCVTACTSYLAAFSLTLSLVVTIGLIADHLAACMSACVGGSVCMCCILSVLTASCTAKLTASRTAKLTASCTAELTASCTTKLTASCTAKLSAKCVTACTFYLAAFLSHRTYFGFLARSMSAGNHSSSSSLYNWDHLQKKETQKTSRFFVSPDGFLMGVMLDTGKIATMRLAPMAHISKVTNHCLACLVVAH